MTRSRSNQKVPPCSKAKIEKISTDFRAALNIPHEKFVDVIRLCEIVLPNIHPNFEFHVLEESEMGDNHACTYPDKSLIQAREDIYQGACAGKGRDRFTLAHEIGHLLLHRDIPFSYREATEPYPIYQDPEWQADYFAGIFLMPTHLIQSYTQVNDVVQAFGVSPTAASTRLAQIGVNF